MIDFSDLRGRELFLLLERAKYERWLANESSALLEREFTRLGDLLSSPAYRSLTQFQQARALELYREIERRLRSTYGQLTSLHLQEMKGYALLEAQVARLQATSVLAVGSSALSIIRGASLPARLIEAIAALPIQGLSIGQWFEGQAQTMSREARRIIQMGLVEGKSPAAIATRLIADRRTEGPVLSRRAINEARIISRTTVNAVQNHALVTSYAALPPSVSDSYRLIAVRDRRTSVICSALADRVYRYDDPKKKVPPFHPNCRTTMLPLLKGATETGTGLTMGTYADWLAAQPTSVQNDILGIARAALFRTGKMSLADAIDADNRVLTLAQLRASIGL